MRKSINIVLLLLNIIILYVHIETRIEETLHYFCQLTVLGEILIIFSFVLAIINGEQHKFSLNHSRFVVFVSSIGTIANIGYWGVRVFLTEGIINPDQVRTNLIQFLAIMMHGGTLTTHYYILFSGKLRLEFKLWRKLLMSAIFLGSYIGIQIAFYHHKGHHIYGFLKVMQWQQLVVFELSLGLIGILSDYFYSFIIEHFENKTKLVSKKQK